MEPVAWLYPRNWGKERYIINKIWFNKLFSIYKPNNYSFSQIIFYVLLTKKNRPLNVRAENVRIDTNYIRKTYSNR